MVFLCLFFRSGLKEEADFVPEEMFNVLAGAFEDLHQLARILQLDWVRTWSGWKEVGTSLDACDDVALKNLYVKMR